MSENMFGGKNAKSLYVPMSETEQEVITRLIESEDLVVIVHGWGKLNNPAIRLGDKRVEITLPMSFSAPETPIKVFYFDLELRTISSNLLLFKDRQPTLINGHPIQVAAGVEFVMMWDISISHLDPKLVKQVKPGAKGLTSRVLDRETGRETLTGNMTLGDDEKSVLAALRAGEARARKATQESLSKAYNKPKE